MLPLLIPLILAAASTAANYQGQQKVNRARTGALSEERRRRESREKQSAASAQSTADLLVRSASDEKTRAGELEQTYKAASAPPAPGATGAPLDALRPAAPVNTIQDPRIAARARAETDALARSRAQLGAFGDVMVGNQIAAGRNAGDIDAVNAGLRNWNQFVLPAQLNAAAGAGRQWNTFADVLQAASMLTSMSALSAPNAAAAPAAAPAAAGTEGQVFTKGVNPLVTQNPYGTTTQFATRSQWLPMR